MTSPQRYLGKKAAKATMRHSVRGTVSKARREPPRTATLLGVGVAGGVLAGWFAARRREVELTEDADPVPGPMDPRVYFPGPQPAFDSKVGAEG